VSPTLAEAHWKAGDLYLADRRIGDAIGAYRRALTADPKAVVPLTNLARIYTEERKDLRQALELAQRAEPLAPKDWYVQDVLGWVLCESGRVPEAIQHLQEAARLEPAAGRARYHLGMAYLKQGKKDEAVAELKTALTLAPSRERRAAIEKVLSGLSR